MNVLPVAEIKRRGMAAIEQALRNGPVHIVKRNRVAVVLSDDNYRALCQPQSRLPVMEPMAQLAVLLKRHDEAAVALGRAKSHYRQLALSMTAQEANLFARLKVDIHSALGHEATERLLSQGRGMTDQHVAQRVMA